MRFHSALLGLALGVCSTQALAQSVYPIRAEPKFAGVYDLSTGRFLPSTPTAGAKSTQTIYRNDCNSNYYVPFGPCVTVFDEGRIPSADPTCASTRNLYDLALVEVAYCTGAATGTVDLDFALYGTRELALCETNTAYAGQAPRWKFDSSAASFPLPGSTVAGQQACWIVGFTASGCISGGPAEDDSFHVSFRNNNTSAETGGLLAGPILAGSASGGTGTGTFCAPAAACATGLGNADRFWANVDGVAVGGTPPACATSAPAMAVTTGCYSLAPFGYAGFYTRIDANVGGACDPAVTAYCTSKVTSAGCTPVLSCFGGPSKSAGAGFQLHASGLRPAKSGIFFYSNAGVQALPFQGGWLCVKNPIKRLPVQNTGVTGGACGTDPTTGVMTTDFNTYMAGSTDPGLTVGNLLLLQAWTRDPQSASATNLTNALYSTIFP
ncbi:MAG: hypothetical protein HZA52_17185 [Planctomycetes bacterium]|nr:hypothetical protein [Planctomycetota bacterium]